MRRRVLLLTQFFDPEPTLKGLAFAKELEKHDFEVEVLTGFPNYPGGKVYQGYRLRLYQREVLDGVVVHRVWLYPSHDQSAKRRILNYASFAFSAAANVWRIKRPDAVYVHHPPATIGIPAAFLKWIRRAPHIYEVQDLWPDTLAATGMMNSSRLLSIIARVMQGNYRRAAKIVVISNGFKRLLIQRGVPPEKITVLPNWAEEGRLEAIPPDPALARELGIYPEHGRPFTVMFAGSFGLAQALDPVIDAAKLLAEDDVRFVFVGSGVDSDRIQERVRNERIENVVFVPRQPMDKMGAILPLADVLLVHLKDDPLFEITIPGKTQAYLSVGVPILMAVKGDAAEIIVAADAGVPVQPGDAHSIATGVRTLHALSPERRTEMGANGRRYYEEHLQMSIGVARYAELFNELLQTRR